MQLNKEIIKDNYLSLIKQKWYAAEDTFPMFITEVTDTVKRENEKYISEISDNLKLLIQSYPRIPLGRKKWKQNILDFLRQVLDNEHVIGIHNYIDEKNMEALKEELMEFLRHVRRFAPELSFEEIGQAIRNYIVYTMFKKLNNVQRGFSMAGFGYSMLYPVTDNYIDNITHSKEDKAEFNRIIYDKIVGKEVNPRTIPQIQTCDLLTAIESEYPRNRDQSIYALLLMMLEAQEHSMGQQHQKELPHKANTNNMHILSAEERLSISLYKGGVSVLIDRYLINKEMTNADFIFYLGMGFFLQLADDLQDIKKDSHEGNQTLFTVDLSSNNEEKLVNKLLSFIKHIMEDYKADNETFKALILSNCYQLIFTSLIGSREFFSNEYITKMEKYLLVNITYLEQSKPDMFDEKLQQKNMKLLDEILF